MTLFLDNQYIYIYIETKFVNSDKTYEIIFMNVLYLSLSTVYNRQSLFNNFSNGMSPKWVDRLMFDCFF